MKDTSVQNSFFSGVQVFEDDGGVLACSVNTTCLALIDSGFAMKNLFAGVTLAVTSSGHILLDPDAARLRKNAPVDAGMVTDNMLCRINCCQNVQSLFIHISNEIMNW